MHVYRCPCCGELIDTDKLQVAEIEKATCNNLGNIEFGEVEKKDE